MSFKMQIMTATSTASRKKKRIIRSCVKILCKLKMEAATLLQICLARVMSLSLTMVALLKNDLKSTLAFKKTNSLFSLSKGSKSLCHLQSSSHHQLHSFLEVIIRNLFNWTKMKKVAMLWAIISAGQLRTSLCKSNLQGQLSLKQIKKLATLLTEKWAWAVMVHKLLKHRVFQSLHLCLKQVLQIKQVWERVTLCKVQHSKRSKPQLFSLHHNHRLHCHKQRKRRIRQQLHSSMILALSVHLLLIIPSLIKWWSSLVNQLQTYSMIQVLVISTMTWQTMLKSSQTLMLLSSMSKLLELRLNLRYLRRNSMAIHLTTASFSSLKIRCHQTTLTLNRLPQSSQVILIALVWVHVRQLMNRTAVWSQQGKRHTLTRLSLLRQNKLTPRGQAKNQTLDTRQLTQWL